MPSEVFISFSHGCSVLAAAVAASVTASYCRSNRQGQQQHLPMLLLRLRPVDAAGTQAAVVAVVAVAAAVVAAAAIATAV